MNKLFLFGFLCLVDCDKVKEPEPKFQFGDIVKFKEGFYKNSNGNIINIWGYQNDDICYDIKISQEVTIVQCESNLELKNENSN